MKRGKFQDTVYNQNRNQHQICENCVHHSHTRKYLSYFTLPTETMQHSLAVRHEHNTIHDKKGYINFCKTCRLSRSVCASYKELKFANKSHIAYKYTDYCLLGAYFGFSGPSVNDRSS